MFVREPLNARHVPLIRVKDNTVCDHYKEWLKAQNLPVIYDEVE